MARSYRKIIITTSVLVAGALLISATYYFKPTQERAPQQSLQAIEVTVVKVQPKTHQLSVVSQGTVSPKYEIDLIAEVTGRIEFVSPNFANGDLRESFGGKKREGHFIIARVFFRLRKLFGRA